MRDVARHAGVSLATVSRVLDGSPLVTEETKLLVHKAVRSLDFVPNISARTLKWGQSHAIGVIVPDLANPFFSEFLREFEATAVADGHVIILANTENSAGRTRDSVRQMLMRRIDGVIAMPSIDELEPYQMLTLKRVPTITIDSRRSGHCFSDVSMMHEEGMLQAVGYLKDLGHRLIAFISGTENLFISNLRLDAFRAALQKHLIPVREEYIRYGTYRVDGGDREMTALMALGKRPTAVVAINDLTAIGALRAARNLALHVPTDVSVIGFDGIQMGELVTPALTTIKVSQEELAKRCYLALTELRSARGLEGKQYRIPVELALRQSAARVQPTSRAVGRH